MPDIHAAQSLSLTSILFADKAIRPVGTAGTDLSPALRFAHQELPSGISRERPVASRLSNFFPLSHLLMARFHTAELPLRSTVAYLVRYSGLAQPSRRCIADGEWYIRDAGCT